MRKRWVSLWIVVLICIISTAKTPVQASQANQLTIDLSQVPTKFHGAFSKMLQWFEQQARQNPNQTTYGISSFEDHGDWAFATLAAFDQKAKYYRGESYSVILKDDKDWLAVMDLMPEFDSIVQEIPASLISTQSRQILLHLNEPIPNAPQVAMKFPWNNGQHWMLTQGWHYEVMYLSQAVDFAPATNSADKQILSAHAGTVTQICNGSLSHAIRLQASDGTQTGYIHIQAGTLNVHLNQSIPQGYLLGSTVEGNGSDNCGTWYGAHVHLELQSQSVTLDGWTANSSNIWTANSGETKGIYDWFGSTNQQGVIRGYIDGPTPNSTIKDTTQVRGWAKIDQSSIREVQIYARLNTANHTFEHIANATYGDYRSDPGIEGPYGWHLDWDTRKYGNGNSEFRVKAITTSGQEQWLPSSASQNPTTTINVTIQNPVHPCFKPLYRYFHPTSLRHTYTSNWAELGFGDVHWNYENLEGYITQTASCHMPNAVALYRVAHTSIIPKHLLVDEYERNVLIDSGNYRDEGILGYFTQQSQSQYATRQLYRLYHSGRNDHFYTISQAEVNAAIASGYQSETFHGYLFDLVNTAPNKPTTTSPGQNTVVHNPSVQLTWTDPGDPDNYPSNYRDYQVEIEAAVGGWTQTRPWSRDATWTLTLPQSGVYYWKVMAGDGMTGSVWSDVMTFTLNQLPNSPTLISPVNNSQQASTTLNLRWQDTGDPDNYPRATRNYWPALWKSDQSWSLYPGWQDATSWSVTVPEPGTYCWRMYSGDGLTPSLPSETRCIYVNNGQFKFFIPLARR